jgi:hypothetical protein
MQPQSAGGTQAMTAKSFKVCYGIWYAALT